MVEGWRVVAWCVAGVCGSGGGGGEELVRNSLRNTRKRKRLNKRSALVREKYAAGYMTVCVAQSGKFNEW
jgi:predicted MFS family arabinose efflux permease